MAVQVECLKEELVNYKANEEERWANRKQTFLDSLKFFDLLGTRFAFLLEKSFNGAIRQFQEAGYPTTRASLDFLDLKKFVDSILDDKIIIFEMCPKTIAFNIVLDV